MMAKNSIMCAPLIESLLQSPARHSLFGMLAGGGGKAYDQAWHHDLATPDLLHPAVIFDPEPFWFTATIRLATTIALQTALVLVVGLACVFAPRLVNANAARG